MSDDTKEHEDWTKNGPHENTMDGAPTGRDRDYEADEALIENIKDRGMASSIGGGKQGYNNSKWAPSHQTDGEHFAAMRHKPHPQQKEREADFFESLGLAEEAVPEEVTGDYVSGCLAECQDFLRSIKRLEYEIKTTVSNNLEHMTPEALFKHQGMAQAVDTIIQGIKERIEELEE